MKTIYVSQNPSKFNCYQQVRWQPVQTDEDQFSPSESYKKTAIQNGDLYITRYLSSSTI